MYTNTFARSLGRSLLLMLACSTAGSWSLSDLTNKDASGGLKQGLGSADKAVSTLGKQDGSSQQR